MLFLNTGDPDRQFADASAVSGFNVDGDGRGLALTDWDADGDLDVWVSNRTAPTMQFFENQRGAAAGEFLAFDLIGTKCNRDAIGARVTVRLEGEDKPLMRSSRAGEGFQSQSGKRVHFGLGSGAQIAEVKVRWPGPDPVIETFTGIAPNGIYRLRQGAGAAEKITPSGGKYIGKSQVAALGSGAGEVTLAVPLPIRPLFPQVRYQSLDESGDEIVHESGNPLLLLLWRPECERCHGEMIQLADEVENFRSLGIDCLALTALDGESGDLSSARSALAATKFPFPAGIADGALIERMLTLHRHLFYRPYHLTVPTAFLLGANGRLATVYRGGIEVDGLAEHVAALNLDGEHLADFAAPFAGTRILEPHGERPAVLIKAYIQSAMPDEAERVFRADLSHPTVAKQPAEIARTIGESFMVAKDYANAKRLLEEALALDPEQATSLNNLGAIALKGGDSAGACQLWERARQTDASYATPRLNLGRQLMKDGNTAGAMAALLEFAKLEPDSADGHHYLAMGYLRGRQFDLAERHLKSLLKQRPSDGAAYSNLAKIYLQRRDFDAARQVLDRGLAAEGIDQAAREALLKLRARL